MKNEDNNIKYKNYEDGQAMVEFVISFPILLLLFFVIIQAGLLYIARHITNYAAFCAARTAIVQIPDNPDESLNKIERSAAIACIPIVQSSPINTLSALQNDMVEQFENFRTDIFNLNISGMAANAALTYLRGETAIQLFNHMKNISIDDGIALLVLEGFNFLVLGKNIINDFWAGNDNSLTGATEIGGLAEKFIMSRVLTLARVLDTGSDKQISVYECETGSDITVEVTHYYSLRVPFVSQLFYFAYINLFLSKKIDNFLKEKNYNDNIRGIITGMVEDIMWNFSKNINLNLCFIPVRGRCTLTVEGEIAN